MDRLSKRKFGIVCHEKVVRIPLEGDEILRVHGECTQGVVKTLMNTKVEEEHGVQLKLVLELLRKEKLYAKFTKSEAFKQENVLAERLHGLDQQMERKEDESYFGRYNEGMSYRFGGSYHSSIRCALFEALNGRKCRLPVLWVEIRESSLTGLELVQGTIDKVTPWKGVVRFGKKGKISLRYIGPIEILEKIGLVVYRLRLPEELNSVNGKFHVLNLKKCLVDANLHVPLSEIKVNKTLRFVEEPIGIMDREVKSDQLEWVLWYALWLSDQLEWICGMLHGLVINWSSSAIETSHNRVNGEYRDDKKDVRKSG
ncbi:hypothetical protein Tco_1054765 [Tanacetum coccineum]|uniref:Tf2-1-like SH3-like domain-containing protein n=1 Tax=Tanacetum coccineum TaxID=301880 RepID=A0ABQ5H036_9ASTR